MHTDGTVPELFHRQLGTEGPAVVFLPGLAASTRYWESRIAPLADDHRVVLVDLLGFGQSPKPWATYSVERQVTELHRVLVHVGPFTLVGHSLGALLAIAYAARYPRAVTGLALFGLPCFASAAEAKRSLRGRSALDRWALSNLLMVAIVCMFSRHVMRPLLPRLLSNLPPEIVEDYLLHTWLSATSTILEVIYRYDPRVDIDRLSTDMPVALLHGEHDSTAPIESVRELVRQYPDWRLDVLPEGDHNVLLNDPEWCLNKLQAFLDAPVPRQFTQLVS